MVTRVGDDKFEGEACKGRVRVKEGSRRVRCVARHVVEDAQFRGGCASISYNKPLSFL